MGTKIFNARPKITLGYLASTDGDVVRQSFERFTRELAGDLLALSRRLVKGEPLHAEPTLLEQVDLVISAAIVARGGILAAKLNLASHGR